MKPAKPIWCVVDEDGFVRDYCWRKSYAWPVSPGQFHGSDKLVKYIPAPAAKSRSLEEFAPKKKGAKRK